MSNKEDYIKALKKELEKMKISQEDTQSVLYDFDEHFDAALSKGEIEQIIIEKLGEPCIRAKEYSFMQEISRAEESPSAKTAFSLIRRGIRGGLLSTLLLVPLFYGQLLLFLSFVVAALLFVGGPVSIVGAIFPQLGIMSFSFIPSGFLRLLLSIAATAVFPFLGLKLAKWTSRQNKRFLSSLFNKVKNNFSEKTAIKK